ncbi:DUF2849 domain-containing protein [Flexibacterium corallicola]|uniref:DUF2849 domain-containing protein n=1 Tax=Flexibacterium corallicola TaxID=3037259 RepID=UPI00286F8750|nr:DUF2849 domain-containing protein [Pseudovibrio sp. M1P-2-3]
MKVITANRLLDGEVVWLGDDNAWVEVISQAVLLNDPEQLEQAKKAAEKAEVDQLVVGAYEIDVVQGQGTVSPSKLKEVIRATGPTTRVDLGKQARAH